jgi:UDPglucose--hexose-1-phosphate uridylyltransferase
MSTIRTDPVTGRQVIVASERADRPRRFRESSDSPSDPEHCPFCRGNEEATPPAIRTIPDDSDDWDIRVVPNKYPAVSSNVELEEFGRAPFRSTSGVGAHEVVVETPEHVVDLHDLSADQIATVLRTWGDRIADLRNDRRLEYVLPFKNQGAPAGASIEHAHSQIVALPSVPPRITEELEGARDHHEETGSCIFCDLVERNLQSSERLVSADDAVAVFAPYAPRFPFELWFVPRDHQAQFDAADEAVYHKLAAALIDTLHRLDRAAESPPYNLVLHTAPLRAGELDHFHWHLELIPTLSYIAGFEWGTGLHINPTPPEDSARHLRNIDVADEATDSTP